MECRASPIHARSQLRQRRIDFASRTIGKVRPHASKPFGRLNELAVASVAQRINFHAVPIRSVPITTSAATRNSAGKKDGNPEAKSQSSNFAGVKIARTASQKQIAIAPARSSDRRSKRKIPMAVSQQQMTDNNIWSRTSQ